MITSFRRIVCWCVVLLIVVTSNSCRRNNNDPTDIGLDVVTCEMAFNDTYKVTRYFLDKALLNSPDAVPTLDTGLTYCHSWTIDPPLDLPDSSTIDPFPRVLTVDFGSGCEAPDGRLRKGKLIIELNGWFDLNNAAAAVSFDKYFVEGVRIEGTYVLTREAEFRFLELITARVFSEDGNAVTWNVDRDRRQGKGNKTADIGDDYYKLIGNTEGVDRNGNSFSAVISDALEFDMNCRYPVIGEYEISSDGSETSTLHLGNGICDRKASIKSGNTSFNIRLDFKAGGS